MKRIKFFRGTIWPLACVLAMLAFVLAMLTFTAVSSVAAPQFRVLYNFHLASDGGFPGAGVIADRAGNLYGTTEGGGYSYSTVYRLTPPNTPGGAWTETTLHSFKASRDGLYPQAALVFDKTGSLYGTTPNGGNAACAGGCGVVFKLTPPPMPSGSWSYTVLYRFTGGSDGERPYHGRLIFDSAGNIYGMTLGGGSATQCSGFGCGTIFELEHPTRTGGAWNEKILHRFGNGSDGTTPFAGLVFNAGNLYGCARMGGGFVNGIVFKLVPPAVKGNAWTEQVLYNFGSRTYDGLLPTSRLIFDNVGRLYGTTQSGGFGCGAGGCGTVFRLTPPASGHTAWTEDVLISFNNSDGNEVDSGVIFDSAGDLYGTTYLGSFYGNLFRLTPQGGTWIETTLHQFSGNDGEGPVGDLIGNGHTLFGVTHDGGGFGSGAVFRIAP